MIDVLVKATNLELYRGNAEPFAKPMERKHVLVIGGAHMTTLGELFPKYAVDATVIVPTGLQNFVHDYQFERAAQFEHAHPTFCRGVGTARDLGGVDSDSVDLLIVSTTLPVVRDAFLRQAWRVTKELGKVVVFSHAELSVKELASYGIANPTYYAAEGFYVGTMRKAAARNRQN